MSLPPHMLSLGRQEKPPGEQGFTLIELIVVTALIGIMLALSIPSLRNTLFTDPLKTTTRKVIGLVTGVRELAVRYHQPYLLYINRLENRIWYEKETKDIKDPENDPLQKEELVFPDSVRIAGIWMANDDNSSQDQTVIWINNQGYLNETVLRIEDGDGNHLNVQFYPFIDPAIVSDEVAPF